MSAAQMIEAAAEAMWKNRAKEITGWGKMLWSDFCREKPDIAAIYRDNARVAVIAIEKLARAA